MVMVELGYEMGYSPKDVMDDLGNDNRAKLGLPPNPVVEGLSFTCSRTVVSTQTNECT